MAQGTGPPLPGPGGSRPNGERQYAPAVMYEPGKVIYIGGGNDAGTDLPSAAVDIIDLNAAAPAPMPAGRKHGLPSTPAQRDDHLPTERSW